MKQRVLVIDDDMDLCRLLKDSLESEGYQVTVCHDGANGIKEFRSKLNNYSYQKTDGLQGYHLIVLDMMLPEKNGYEVLQEIRAASHVPILMLTAKDSEGDKVASLRMGADDYLTKPFSNSEFLARVFALLRRETQFHMQGGGTVSGGGLSVDIAKREVYKEGCPIELTAKEFDLLLFLMEHAGQVFTKKQIYTAVWAEEYLYDDNNIMVHIRRLRKKIEDNPENPKYVVTVWGVGYKFGGGV